MNKIILKGRMTKEPEIKNTQSDKAYTRFGIAVQRDKDNADFINCVAWEKTAEFITKYFKKGQEILILGRLENRKYEDKTYTEVVIEQAEFCGSNKTGNDNVGEVIREVKNTNEVDNEEDDLPF